MASGRRRCAGARCSTMSSRRDRAARRRLHGRRLRPRRAQHRQHQRSPARASTTGRGAGRPIGTRASPPPISTTPGSTPSAASPRRSTGTSPSSRSRCALIAPAEALIAGARALPDCGSSEALRDALFARLGVVPGPIEEDIAADRRDRGGACQARRVRSTASSSTGAAAGRAATIRPMPSSTRCAAMLADTRRSRARSTIPIGPIPSPARC